MFSSYNHRVTTSARFKMLVAHPQQSSDPSRGEAGNPVPIRQVFETQIVTTHMGTGRLGLVKSENPVLIRIIVDTIDFSNVNVAPNPIYPMDEIQILGQGYFDVDRINALKAGTHFANGMGNQAGDVDDVAEDLASVLNDMRAGLNASVDPNNLNHVLVRSVGLVDALFVRVFSYSYLLFGGTPPFLFQDGDGNVLYDPTLSEGGSGTFLVRAKGLDPMGRS
jgi:hypothetical protein